VPLLSPHAAAYLGTAAELGLPVLLALGIGTRFAAIAFSSSTSSP
jgi:putative oxidoreductase